MVQRFKSQAAAVQSSCSASSPARAHWWTGHSSHPSPPAAGRMEYWALERVVEVFEVSTGVGLRGFESASIEDVTIQKLEFKYSQN